MKTISTGLNFIIYYKLLTIERETLLTPVNSKGGRRLEYLNDFRLRRDSRPFITY